MVDKFDFILGAHGLKNLAENSYTITTPTGNLIAASQFEQRILPKLFIHVPTEVRQGILSSLGTPVFDTLSLQAADEEGNFTEIVFDAVLIDVTQTKNIVKTTVQGRKGTIKEYINDGDYIVKLKGVITSGKKDYYPTEAVAKFKKIWSVTTEIDIISEYLQMLGIYQLVIESISLNQKEGFMNTLIFDLTASSEIPFELQEANA